VAAQGIQGDRGLAVELDAHCGGMASDEQGPGGSHEVWVPNSSSTSVSARNRKTSGDRLDRQDHRIGPLRAMAPLKLEIMHSRGTPERSSGEQGIDIERVNSIEQGRQERFHAVGSCHPWWPANTTSACGGPHEPGR
jgi:hypothetical protein